MEVDDPVLLKIAEAAAYIRDGAPNEPLALSDHSVLLQGADGCHAHVDYDSATGGIVCCFVGGKDWSAVTKQRCSGRECPSWAPSSDIQVHKLLLKQFDSFLKPEVKGQLTLLETGSYLSKVRAVRFYVLTSSRNFANVLMR